MWLCVADSWTCMHDQIQMERTMSIFERATHASRSRDVRPANHPRRVRPRQLWPAGRPARWCVASSRQRRNLSVQLFYLPERWQGLPSGRPWLMAWTVHTLRAVPAQGPCMICFPFSAPATARIASRSSSFEESGRGKALDRPEHARPRARRSTSLSLKKTWPS
jgi:hypothetical protein